MLTNDPHLLQVYRPVAVLDEHHAVELVQHTISKKIFVKKELTVYSAAVYEQLMDNPIPCMPRIYAAVEQAGHLTVIEEYLSGDTLQFLLDNYGVFAEEQAAEIVDRLCVIVHQLHTASPAIIHRDIKPSNILRTFDGTVQLLDVNAARQFVLQQGQDTCTMGTVGFAAPEQYGFQQSSAQSDIYAIGVLLNVLLTGVLPSVQLAPGRLQSVIRKCTELSPKERYSSVDELRRALAQAMGWLPTASTAYRYAWQKFLPPGLRSLQLPGAGFAFLGYLMLYWASLTLEVEDATLAQIWANRIACTLIFTLMILLSGNYLDIQRHLPLTKSNRKLVQFLGIIVYDVLIFLLVLVPFSIIGL